MGHPEQPEPPAFFVAIAEAMADFIMEYPEDRREDVTNAIMNVMTTRLRTLIRERLAACPPTTTPSSTTNT